MTDQGTYYHQWQMQKYGNVLPEGTSAEEFEAGEQDKRDQLVWFEQEEQILIEEQSF